MKKFRYISLFLVITFFTVSLSPQNANASVGAGVLSAGTVLGEGGASALSATLGPVGLIVSAAIMAGVVYKNREQIKSFTLGALNYLNEKGQGIGKGIVDIGNGVATISSEAKVSLMEYIQGLKTREIQETTVVPLVKTVSIAPGQTVWTTVSIPFNKDMNIYLELLATGKMHIENLNFIYKMKGYDSTFTGGRKDNVCFYGNKMWFGNSSISLPSYDTILVGVTNRGTFPTDFGIVQNIPNDRSVCVDAKPNFQNPSLSNTGVSTRVGVLNPGIDFNYDDFVNVTDVKNKVTVEDNKDTTKDDTKDDTKDKENDGILDWLKSIPKWFVVDWDLVIQHADYSKILETKLKPLYEISTLLSNIKANPQSHSGKFYMKIPHEMGGDDQEHCVLDLSFGDVYFKTARGIIKAGMWVGFLFFILRVFRPKFTIGG